MRGEAQKAPWLVALTMMALALLAGAYFYNQSETERIRQ